MDVISKVFKFDEIVEESINAKKEILNAFIEKRLNLLENDNFNEKEVERLENEIRKVKSAIDLDMLLGGKIKVSNNKYKENCSTITLGMNKKKIYLEQLNKKISNSNEYCEESYLENIKDLVESSIRTDEVVLHSYKYFFNT